MSEPASPSEPGASPGGLTRLAPHLVWVVPALAAGLQVGLMLYTVARRFFYPFDLEWMEGGVLTHALRYQQGHDIYAAPSADFIPYLYTPLYPMLLARSSVSPTSWVAA